MSHPRRPALAKLLQAPDPHAADTRRIPAGVVQEVLRRAEVHSRLTSGTRKVVTAEEISAHLAQNAAADDDDEAVDVKLDSLAPPAAPSGVHQRPTTRISPLTPIVITPFAIATDPHRTTLSRARVPTIAILLLASSALFALASGIWLLFQ